MMARVLTAITAIITGAMLFVLLGEIAFDYLKILFVTLLGLGSPSYIWLIYVIITGTVVASHVKQVMLGGIAFSVIVAALALLLGDWFGLTIAVMPWVSYGVWKLIMH